MKAFKDKARLSAPGAEESLEVNDEQSWKEVASNWTVEFMPQ